MEGIKPVSWDTRGIADHVTFRVSIDNAEPDTGEVFFLNLKSP